MPVTAVSSGLAAAACRWGSAAVWAPSAVRLNTRRTDRPSSRTRSAVHESRVGELRLAEGEFDAKQRVVAEAARLGDVGAGGEQGVPGAARLVGGEVLDRVDEVGDPAEELPGLRQRRLVRRLAGEHRGVRERRARRDLGRIRDVTAKSPAQRPPRRPSAAIASVSTPTSKPSSPPVRALAAAHRAARAVAAPRTPRQAEGAVTVVRVVADLRGGQDQDTVAASRAQSPTATSALRIPRSAPGGRPSAPADRPPAPPVEPR